RSLRDSSSDMRLQATYSVNKSISSNEDALTASAGSAATPGSYGVTVNQLAQGVTKGSQSALAEEKNADGTVKTLAQQLGLTGTINFTLEGKNDDGSPLSKAFSIDTENMTIISLVQEINDAELGIFANYDSSSNRFILTSKSTGADYGVKVTNDADEFLSDAAGNGSGKLKLLLATDTRVSGQDALYSFGDMANLTSATNSVSVGGITMNLKQGGGASSTITIARDSDSVYNTIKSFVEKYNSTIDLVNKELSEKRDRDYLPLTDSQREELSESQQALWEEKAKGGLLRNDQLLTSTVSRMREIMGSVLEGISGTIVEGRAVTHNSLASIGIITGSYQEKGKLTLKNNGEDLKKAIEADPDGVMKIFVNDDEDNPGIAKDLYEAINSSMTGIVEKAGYEYSTSTYDQSSLGKKIYRYNEDLVALTERMSIIEERYYKQFTAMEKAVNLMNNQSAWLSQQMGSSTNS
ncbi:MAG: flagellar filament capping protein FliD, partial [Peptococcaceae bacterium]|nr:flagellar filament capping protein FliD [Peptococcaceae bacterium]